MTTMQEVLAQDRRLAVLRTLEEAPGFQLNEGTLHHALTYLGHSVSHDTLRSDASWLKEQALVHVEVLQPPSGVLWLIKLTDRGGDVASGRARHPGVATRGPE